MLLERAGIMDPASEDLGPHVIILDSVFLFLATIALAIRIWSRKIKGSDLCLNDYAVLAAWV